MSDQNPHKYGTPEFAAWRRNAPAREAVQRASEQARQATHNLQENERLQTERRARLKAEREQRQKERNQADDARLAPEREKMRREYLIQHGATKGAEFDRLWDTELRASLLVTERERLLENEIAVQRKRMAI